MSLKAFRLALLGPLALVLGLLVLPRVASSQAPTLLFGSYLNSAKAVQVDSAGRLKISLGAGITPVPNGGTGLATLTAHNVLIGNGTSPVTLVPGGTDCYLHWATSGVDPTCATVAAGGAPGGATNTIQYNAGSSTFGGIALNATATKMYLQQVSSGVAAFAQVAVADLSGFAANVATWLATPSSANLAAALTDETGSGLAVFGTSPTIVTPTIASFANATHNHSNAAGGGTIAVSVLTGFGSGVATFLATPTGANLAAAVTAPLNPLTNRSAAFNTAVQSIPDSSNTALTFNTNSYDVD